MKIKFTVTLSDNKTVRGFQEEGASTAAEEIKTVIVEHVRELLNDRLLNMPDEVDGDDGDDDDSN